MRLLNSQKANLFEAISSNGLNPSQFLLLHADDDLKQPATLKLKESDYYFGLEYLEKVAVGANMFSGWRCTFVPGKNIWKSVGSIGSWEGVVIPAIKAWFQNLAEELKIPDPWKALNKTPLPEAGVSSAVENTAFTYNEREKVIDGIQNIERLFLQHVQATEGSTEAQAYITDQLTRIIEDSKTFGRKDWFNQAVGTIINIVVALAITDEVTRQAWQLLKAAVSEVILLTPVVVEGVKQLVPP